MTTEIILGIAAGVFSLNFQIAKIISNKKEEKVLKKMHENTEKLLIPFSEKLKTHDKKFSDFRIRLEECLKDVVDLKILITKTETNFNNIKETLNELKEKSDEILRCANRTREDGEFIERRKK